MEVSGDTRYDQVIKRLSQPSTINFDLSVAPESKVILCGSTWPQDEKIILAPIVNKITNTAHKLIIAPHEVSEKHITQLKKELTEKGLKTALYSETNAWSDNQALIIDTIGILATLYEFADISFVGGSFKSKVHSVMEPLACGNLVFVGPKNSNNREAQVFKNIEALHDINCVTEIVGAKDIDLYLDQALISSGYKPLIKDNVKVKTGATLRLIKQLQENHHERL